MTFADKVVIMYGGELVQTGSPDELFESPEHSFVGYFIGSPGMNFLECRLEGAVAVVNGASIPVDPELAAKAAALGGPVKLGIRPMYLGVGEPDTPGGVPARVSFVEDQGHCRIVTLALGSRTLKARVKDGRTIPDGACALTFPKDKAKLFVDDRLVHSGGDNG